MKKRINADSVVLAFEIALLPIKAKLKEAFEDYPVDDEGVLVEWDDLENAANILITQAGVLLSDLLDTEVSTDLNPEPRHGPPDIPPTPAKKYEFKKVIHGLRFRHNKPFTWLDRTGADLGGEVLFTWPECDGAELLVPDATKDFSPFGHAHATYFCGTNNKPEESNGKRASIFGPAGCRKGTYVEMYYNKV
jgi:hypothetical protein